jgi:hypothetical protein
MPESFSQRQGYSSSPKEITIREGVTDYVRHYAIKDAIGEGLSDHALRDMVCRIVRAVPDANNWSHGPVVNEVEELVSSCDWWLVYDIIESIYQHLAHYSYQREEGDFAESYAALVNKMFMDEGIGWKLEGGAIVSRGSDLLETPVKNAVAALAEAQRNTASDRLHEASKALSRRPKPDLAGAASHALGALECVARDVTGDEKATLGELIKKYPDLIPPPLDSGVSKLWGYASDRARHVVEGKAVTYEEVELALGVAANVIIYLGKKFPRK